MKKSLYVIGVLAVAVFTTMNLLAGSVDYLSNQSAEFMRTLNRNAAIDAADAVNYNPAGVVKMQDGLFANASGQYIMKTYTAEDNDPNHFFNTKEYKSDVPSIIPNIYALYKQNNWAAFAAFTVPAGGGKLEFGEGTPMLRSALYQQVVTATYEYLISLGTPAENAATMAASTASDVVDNIDKLTLESMYYAGTLGGAYKINDMFSVSLGARYILGNKTINLTAKEEDPYYTDGKDIADLELEASGFGGVIGFNASPMPELNIGVRYETVTKLEWDTTVNTGDAAVNQLGYADGKTEKKDLPALFALGVSYDIMPELKASTTFTYYFIKQAKWEHYEGTKTNKEYDNGFDAGLAGEYNIMPNLLVSAGYLYSKVGGNDKTWNDFEMALDSNSIACGARYEIIPGLNVNLGLCWTMYINGTNESDVTYTKDAKIIALGVEYKFL